jgi:hypothetical protein
MQQPNLFVKIAVVSSSVLLVGGLVAYRAGAFNRAKEDTSATMGGTKSKALIESPSPETPAVEHRIKWSYDWSPGALSVLNSDEPVLMSGSKSAPVIILPPASAGAKEPVLPGPKSGVPVITLPDVTKPPVPPQRADPAPPSK